MLKENVPIQMTFSKNGHTLHHTQIQSSDGKFLVFDSRNEDSKIGQTATIEILDLSNKETKIIYSPINYNSYGPGVGAATFSPITNFVLFIHGIRNSNQDKPYSIYRRTGVSVDINNPNKPIFMDARDVVEPFTKGALRGGTHSHCWHKSGNLISFTYNDYILQKNKQGDFDNRVVGVMFRKKVSVKIDEDLENNSGEMFSVIVTEIVNEATADSDEIEKAFDECWLGFENKLAFQAMVRDENNNLKTEIFIVNLPENLNEIDGESLQGSKYKRCSVPNNIFQKRISFTNKGISKFRHWLRSSIDGNFIFFLMEDENDITQIFEIQVKTSNVTQVTFLKKSIQSPFNLKNDEFIFFSNNSLILYDRVNSVENVLCVNDDEMTLTGIPHFSNNSDEIFFNAYVSNYIQIFKIKKYC